MAYQVLARKWRPKNFAELVGQEHVLRALVNALDEDRLHHAYLFTGTRGVGKTTIARIIAKSLNCDKGISSTPCGECASCTEIDEGRFVDLIEVDAASRTKVDDTRELLDNVQYTPTRGRYKVYLIDEVHMLSTSSFNALLKTLEEPPPHVKFLLATTDPQKLPATVLSRCLQFNLKQMPPEAIVAHHEHILAAENIEFDQQALKHIARAAEGSMRDSLSLLDQAIAFGHGQVRSDDVISMLGFISRDHIEHILRALSQRDSVQMMQSVSALAEMAPDFVTVFNELITTLHQLALALRLPEAVDDSAMDRERLLELAQAFSEEDIQLYYQMALMGKRDLPLLPEPRQGLEMTLLRMLAFRPADWHGEADVKKPSAALKPEAPAPQPEAAPPAVEPPRSQPSEDGAQVATSAAPAAQLQSDEARDVVKAAVPDFSHLEPNTDTESAADIVAADEQPVTALSIESAPLAKAPAASSSGTEPWAETVSRLAISPLALQLAKNSRLLSQSGEEVVLALSQSLEPLTSPANVEALAAGLGVLWGRSCSVRIELQNEVQNTPAQRDEQVHDAEHQALLDSVKKDPFIKSLEHQFQANVNLDAIRIIEQKP